MLWGLVWLRSPALGFFDFLPSTAVLLRVLCKTVRPQTWRVAILGSALTTLGAWGVFVAWLGTQMPVGSLFLPD